MSGEARDDDLTLLHRAAAGDRSAFETFVERHQAALSRFSKVLVSDGDAEDLLQETFLTAWRKAASFRGSGSARSWLFTIARRQVLRSARRPVPEAAGDAASLEELAERAGWGRSDRAGVTGLDDQVLLHQGFERLAAGDRAILLLRDLEGLSSAETGRVLGLAVAAVKSRLHRARLRLIAVLNQGDRDGE